MRNALHSGTPMVPSFAFHSSRRSLTDFDALATWSVLQGDQRDAGSVTGARSLLPPVLAHLRYPLVA